MAHHENLFTIWLNEFVILLGYKGYCIKEYFANYFLHQSDVTFDLGTNHIEVHNNTSEPWKVTLLETGMQQVINHIMKIFIFLFVLIFMLDRLKIKKLQKWQ